MRWGRFIKSFRRRALAPFGLLRSPAHVMADCSSTPTGDADVQDATYRARDPAGGRDSSPCTGQGGGAIVAPCGARPCVTRADGPRRARRAGVRDPIFCARDLSGAGDIPRARRYLARAALSDARETLQARATGGGCDPLPRRIPLIPLNPGESRFGISRIHGTPASRGTRKVRRLAHRRFQSGADGSIIPGAAPKCAPGRMR